MMRFIRNAALAWLAFSVVQAVAGALLLRGTPPAGPGTLPLALVSNALIALVVAALAARWTARGWGRVLGLVAVAWGITANNLVEAVAFSLDIPRATLPMLFVASFLSTLALALALDRLMGAAAGAVAWPAGRSMGSWIGRVVASDLLYVVFYIGAGMIVFPFVKDFYAGKPIPGFGVLVPLQLVRGLVFVGLFLVMAARLALPRAGLALLAGLTLAVLGGVAPLLVPNPFMPGPVRMAHMAETGLSNFLFGWLATLILTAPRKDRAPAAAPSSVPAA